MFPAGEELPIRIEFVGDTVESIRRFDPGTQRSVETLDRFGIVPVRESRLSPGLTGRTPCDICFSSCVTRDAQVWVSEPTDVENHVKSSLGAARDVVQRCASSEPKALAAAASRPI